jgi:hypothetical protein
VNMVAGGREYRGKMVVFLALAFFAGVAADYFWLRALMPKSESGFTARDARTIMSADASKKWQGGLGNFGIQSGDLLLSVNGIKDESMMQELVNGYNRGKVCVLYERERNVLEVCLEKKGGQ